MSAASPLIAGTSAWLLAASTTAAILTPAAWLACRMFKTRSAAARYQIWLYVLFAIVLLPSLRLGMPKVTLSVLPDQGRSIPAEASIAVAELPRTAQPVLTEKAPTRAAPSPSKEAVPPSEVRWTTWLLALWFVGLCWMLSRLAVGASRLRGLRRRAQVASAERVRAIGTAMPARLLLSDEIEGPATCGLLRPVVVLPTSVFEATDTEGVRMILEHECAHIRRRDRTWAWDTASPPRVPTRRQASPSR